MIIDMTNLDAAAARYSALYGKDAYDHVGSEISSSVGLKDWDKAYYLQRLQWRIRKLERVQQLSAQAQRRAIVMTTPRQAQRASG